MPRKKLAQPYKPTAADRLDAAKLTAERNRLGRLWLRPDAAEWFSKHAPKTPEELAVAMGLPANATYKQIEGELGRRAHPVSSIADSDGERSMPMSKAQMRVRLDNITISKFESFARPHGLKMVGNNRQLWTIRLDGMDARTRAKLEAK